VNSVAYNDIPLEKIRALPLLHRATVPESYLDEMGHMNVRYYLALFDDGVQPFFDSFGMSMDYFRQNQTGGFALAHFIRYLNEVMQGDEVAIHARGIARSERRIHFMTFMINETRGKLAATMEGLGSHADLTIRRTSPYPPEIAEKLDEILRGHQALDWEPPLSGAIRA
jgi:acyl-CoA thioester hydrolase